jgi:hypothetical protein
MELEVPYDIVKDNDLPSTDEHKIAYAYCKAIVLFYGEKFS